MTPTVTVIGLDGGPLRPEAAAALAGAGVVLGGARHLTQVELPEACARITMGELTAALNALRRAMAERGGSAVVLASGDPGFFGIVRRLRAEGFAPTVHPAVSSLAQAFARLGLSWEAAAIVSAHGREVRAALNACRALPLVGVLTAPGAGPGVFGAGLRGWPRRLVVLERLGLPDERVTEISAEAASHRTWAEPNVLISIADRRSESGSAPDLGRPRADNQPGAPDPTGWARPEAAYQHRDGMITKAEVRAWAVARLRPRLGRLIWDVGSGSGSVGLECAGLGAAVIAVDDDPQACALVEANARRFDAEVRIVCGRAPGVLGDLPDPDAVFIGGGGPPVLTGVIGRRAPLIVLALTALDRVQPCVALLREHGYTVEGVQLAAQRLVDLPGGSLRLQAMNPITVITGELL